MKTIVVLSVAALGMGLLACKKEKAELNTFQPPQNSMPVTYLPMKIGAYWIYRLGMMDTLGNISYPFNAYDSVYIASDSLINGAIYYKFKHTSGLFIGYYQLNSLQPSSLIIDSARYLIPYQG
jgi:hypothetical protein